MHKLIGGTRAQFRTCKAHYLARSVGRPKRRYTGLFRQAYLLVLSVYLEIFLFSNAVAAIELLASLPFFRRDFHKIISPGPEVLS